MQSKTDSLQLATNDIETELKATYEDLDRYKGQNTQLDSMLTEANTRVDEQKTRRMMCKGQRDEAIADGLKIYFPHTTSEEFNNQFAIFKTNATETFLALEA